MTAEELEDAGLIAIHRTPLDVPLTPVADALARGGIRAMEVTLNTPRALEGIAQLRRERAGAIHVGAGTILDAADAERAISAGAEFIITPTVQADTIALCRARSVPVACGAMTPTEALAVHRAGADFVKLFPAETLGPRHVRALLAPLPFLKIVPTGGVNKDTLADFIRAGCAGAALGSNLISRDILQAQDWGRLTELAREYAHILRRARADRDATSEA